MDSAIAREDALKLKEIFYEHVEGYSARQKVIRKWLQLPSRLLRSVDSRAVAVDRRGHSSAVVRLSRRDADGV